MHHPTAKQSLQALFSSLPTSDSADPTQTAQAFMMAIDGIPDQFVSDAAKRFIQGRVPRKSHAFLPTPPEFAVEARKCWEEARAAAYKPKALAPPEKPVSEAERAKVAALFESLCRQMDSAPKRETPVINPDQELELMADAARQPIRVSAALIERISK